MENKLPSAAETAKSLFLELELTELTLKDGDFELQLKKTPAPVVAAPAMPAAAAPRLNPPPPAGTGRPWPTVRKSSLPLWASCI